MLIWDLVIAVYGVLFLDWNQQSNPEHRPFEGVCYSGLTMEPKGTCTDICRFGLGSLD